MYALKDKITQVTVFNDRAQVTREAKISLEKGVFELVFENLPEDIDPQSVQVNGTGVGVLTNVQFNKIQIENGTYSQKEIYPITQEQLIYREQIRQQSDAIYRLEKEKAFLDRITEKVTNNGLEAGVELINPRNWQQMLGFYQEKMEEYDDAIYEIEKEKKQTENALNRLERQLEDMRIKQVKSQYAVEVQIKLKKEGDVSLSLSYVVKNAGWIPIYDIRVSSKEKKLLLQYKALVRQSSSENWEDVKLQLSTARPQVKGEAPKLYPWRLQIKNPIPAKPLAYATPSGGANRSKKSKKIEDAMSDFETGVDLYTLKEEKPNLSYDETEVKSGATSVFFQVNGNHSIKSDNTEHQINVLATEFEADFWYFAVPKLSPFAYLKVKSVNNTDYPLLAGETNVFLDNNFVANASLNTTAPKEEYWTSLGIDEGIKVEHKFLKRYEKTSGGVFSKKTATIVYEYAIEVTNNKNSEEKIILKDQIPISQNQEIKVTLLKPSYQEDNEYLKKNEFEFLEWFNTLKHQEKWNIDLVFSVEYPKDKLIEGI